MTTIGVVGLGHWGSKVIDEYADLRESDEIEEVVACDLDENRLDEVNNVEQKYSDLESVFQRVDGLHICTPNSTHASIGTEAIQSGVDVMIEKPITTNRNTAFDLMELASQENCIIQTGHIYRFANVVQELRNLYQSGRFGSLNNVTLRWTHNIDPHNETDVLWDLAPHPIDILNFVTDDWPSEEVCRTQTQPETEGPTAATAQFSIAGADAIMQVSWDDYVRRRSIELSGSEASAIVEAVNQSIEIHDDEGIHEYPIEANNTIRAEALNFINAIQTRQNMANSAVVGVRTVEAIERLQEEVRI